VFQGATRPQLRPFDLDAVERFDRIDGNPGEMGDRNSMILGVAGGKLKALNDRLLYILPAPSSKAMRRPLVCTASTISPHAFMRKMLGKKDGES
jgi:hypothetical protein